MKKMTAIILALLFMVVCHAPVDAASPWTQYDSYYVKTNEKLGFGFQNVITGWTEIYNVPKRYKAEGKSVVSGVAKGLGNALVYTVGGALHLATFFIPVDIPLPNNGIDIYAKEPTPPAKAYTTAKA